MENRNPFDIDGLTFQQVSPNLIKARFISLSPVALLAVALAWAAWVLIDPRAGMVLAALALALAGWMLWLIPRQVRAIGYAETESDLVIRRGIMFRSIRIVPYGRMQFVDMHQGPIDRWLGISAVKLFTASASTDAALPGVPADEAGKLRDRLTSRGEAKLAGL